MVHDLRRAGDREQGAEEIDVEQMEIPSTSSGGGSRFVAAPLHVAIEALYLVRAE